VRTLSSALMVLLCSLGVAAVTAGGCSQGSSESPGASGGAAMGGTTSLGGTSLTGGSVGSGGTVGTGGTSVASGGTQTTGGAVATGGATGKGGKTSAGGRTSAGGATDTGGATGRGGRADAGPPTKDTAEPTEDAPADAVPTNKDVAAADVTEPQTCPAGLPAPTAGNKKGTLQHGGRSRTYTLHVPSGLAAGKPLAVVFDFHGAGGNGSQQQGMSGWASLGDREGFLTVFPDGVDGYWNVDDTCCGTAGKSKIDDIGFVKAIVEKLGTEMCIDSKRIYASGFSNGGGFTHRIGCDAADVFAAIAPMSTDLRTQPCNAARPITMIETRGMADSLEPYEGGLVGPAGGQYVLVGAKESLKLWAAINKCTDTAKEYEKYCEGHTQCGDGVETDLCSLPGVDHSPYNNSLGFNVAANAWKIFLRQPMK
jgi:polyhydroxybutyrate depolymerase